MRVLQEVHTLPATVDASAATATAYTVIPIGVWDLTSVRIIHDAGTASETGAKWDVQVNGVSILTAPVAADQGDSPTWTLTETPFTLPINPRRHTVQAGDTLTVKLLKIGASNASTTNTVVSIAYQGRMG